MKFTLWPTINVGLALIRCLVLALMVEAVYAATPTRIVDDKLKPYVEDYMMIARQHCRPDQYFYPDKFTISVKKIDQTGTDPSKTTIGECWDIYPYNFIIDIDESLFKNHSQAQLKSVIFHELYHCVFLKDNKDHNTDPKNYFNATSYPDIQESDLYDQIIADFDKACKK